MNDKLLKLIQPIPLEEPLPIDKEVLAELESVSLRHNLSMLLYVQLQKYHNKFPENYDVQNYLEERKHIFFKNAAHCIRQEAIEKETISHLASKGIPAIVIKGNTIANDVYNAPYCRTSIDIDILIKISDVLRADSILTKRGYTRLDKNPLKYWISRFHHAVYAHPRANDFVEIHWNFGTPYFFKLNSEELWDEVNLSDSSQLELSPDMVLIQLFIHHHQHEFRVFKIILDILWALAKYENEVNWHVFSEKLKNIGLVKATQIALRQIRWLWKESIEDMLYLNAFGHAIEKNGYNIPNFLYSYFEIDLNFSYIIPKKEYLKDRIAFRFTLDRWPTIFLSFLKTALASPEAIKELYEDKRNWALPNNYLKFIKWRLIDWTS